MKQHFCLAEQSMIAFEKECNWCGEQEGSMTQDEIIEMAREADIDHHRLWNDDGTNRLEAFAKLVAAKEREACALIGDSMDACQDGAIGKAIRARGQA
jgi:hypothetical protein